MVITVNGEEITSTQLHPYWVVEGNGLADRPVREHLFAPPENSKLAGRWIDAVDLQPGDTLFLQETGPTRIESVRIEPANYPVYNFAVDNLKCYAVGKCSVLVHNSNGLEVPAGTPVGRSGQQHVFPNPEYPSPRNNPTSISGRDYSGHAIDRMQERGFVPSVVENAIATGTQAAGNQPGTVVVTDAVNRLRVILDEASGRVITVIPGV